MNYQHINATLQSLLNQFDFHHVKGGCSLTIFHQGNLVSDIQFGEPNIHGQPSWNQHTLSLNYSTGKGVLATLVHILVAKDLLNYDTPIADYWHEFAQNHKQHITLRDVLSHEAGLFDITSVTDNAYDVQDWHTMLAKITKMPISPKKLALQKTEKFVAYSALVSGWVLGGLIEKVTNLSLQQALEQYLCEPLGLIGEVYFQLDLNKINQIAVPERVINLSNRTKPVITADTAEVLAFYQNLVCYPTWQKLSNKDSKKPLSTQDINQLYFNIRKIDMADYKASLVPKQSRTFDYYHPQILTSQIPAANVVASSFAMAKIYALLANRGEIDGKILIDKKTFAKLKTIQNQQFDRVMPAMMNWRLGYHRVFSICHDVSHAFGHTGYNGSMAWCDPSRALSLAFVHNYDVTMLTDIRQFIINETVLDLFK